MTDNTITQTNENIELIQNSDGWQRTTTIETGYENSFNVEDEFNGARRTLNISIKNSDVNKSELDINGLVFKGIELIAFLDFIKKL